MVQNLPNRVTMKNGLLLILIVFATNCFGQLNCKTSKNDKNESIKTCFHKNGKVSTEEIWDFDKRFGSMRGFNNQGKELFFHYLRGVGGHASVSLEYFPNGQVSKVHFSDAPDGGIQFYNSTTKFDENGNQTEFYETKYPNELEIQWVEPVKMPEVVSEPKKEAPKQDVAECAVIAQTQYKIENTTTSRVNLKITAVPNKKVTAQSKEIVLESSEKLTFDTIFTAERPINEIIYAAEIISYTKARKNKNLKFVESVPVDEPNGPRVYSWFIVKE